jgi:hypothetical protein
MSDKENRSEHSYFPVFDAAQIEVLDPVVEVDAALRVHIKANTKFVEGGFAGHMPVAVEGHTVYVNATVYRKEIQVCQIID